MRELRYLWLPVFGYSYKAFDPAIHVRASGREVNVSPKAAREICRTVKGMRLPRAISLLEDVSGMKVPIAFRRHKLKVGHRSELNKFPTGSFPVKAARHVLTVLRNLQNNCEFKGMDPDRVEILQASTSRGRTIKDYTPRAFGRSSPNFHVLVHLEFVAREVG